MQTDEWILQSSHQYSTTSTRNESILLPRLRGVNWAVAHSSGDVSTDENGRSDAASIQTSLETSLKRIASGKASANDFGKTVRALEEGDRERRDGVQRLQPYPYELWGGMLMAFSTCGGVIMILWRRGGGSATEMAELRNRLRTLEEILQVEAEDRRGRRGKTLERLANLDSRMTAHEQTCMSALSNLESAVGNQPGRAGV